MRVCVPLRHPVVDRVQQRRGGVQRQDRALCGASDAGECRALCGASDAGE